MEPTAAIDTKALLRRCMDDPDFACVILQGFRARIDALATALHGGLNERSLEKIVFAAHTLRGVAGQASAVRLADVALQIERAAATDMVRATTLLSTFDHELQRCIESVPGSIDLLRSTSNAAAQPV